MAKEYRDKKYIHDLFIQADDGKLYYLTKAEWQQREVDPAEVHEEVREAMNVRTTVAALPEEEGMPKTSPTFDEAGVPSVGLGACYYLSIATLRVRGG